MNKQVFSAKTMLINTMHDAHHAINNNQCKLAIRLLKNKIDEIEKLDKCPYTEVDYY